MQEEVNKTDRIAQQKDQVKYPDLADLPILGLPIFKDGLKCKGKTIQDIECKYICRDLRTMKTHCRTEHNWKNPQRGGRDIRKKRAIREGRLQERGQHYQKFFEFAQQKRYFQVSEQLEQGRQYNVKNEDVDIERLVEELEESIVEKRKDREIEGSSSRYLPNLQLEYIGQDEHLKDFKRLELLQITEGRGQEGREERIEEQKQEDRELA